MLSVKVNNNQAMVKFGPTGIPVAVRNALRGVLPALTKKLGDEIENNLNTGLKTRRRLVVKKEMVENPTGIYGRVTTISTSEPYMLPLWLEDGTAPHIIRAKNASALFFFWEKVGQNVAFVQVSHPGFRGIQFTKNAWDKLEPEIKETIKVEVRAAMGSAGFVGNIIGNFL